MNISSPAGYVLTAGTARIRRPMLSSLLPRGSRMPVSVLGGVHRSQRYCVAGMSTTTTQETLQSFDPATSKVLGQVPVASQEQVNEAVQKAQQSQKTWSKYSVEERVEQISQAYQSLQASHKELAQLLAMEMGKNLRQAEQEVSSAIRSGPKLAQEVANALQPQEIPPRRPGSKTRLMQHYVALGVVGIISPWNYPVLMAHNLLIPSLIAGNTVVLKPSEETPLIAQEFFGRIVQALPPDVLTMLHGDGKVGQALVQQEELAMIAFTGSRATGKEIMRQSAPTLKRLVMELGGNDPMIVMKDADLDKAAQLAVAVGMENTGQMCTSIERVYVDQSIADDFHQKVIILAKDYQPGPWDQTNAQMGPIINKKQYDKIVQHIQDAHDMGGNLLVGSLNPTPPYIPPTIITEMVPKMKIEHDETFGPVVGISSFQSIDEAIERANNSVYGLGAIVFGYDGVEEVASSLEVGMVGINQGIGGGGPWVGAKQSGFGYHGTNDGHRQFAQVKVISERKK